MSPNPRPVMTTITRKIDYTDKLTVHDLADLMDGVPEYAEVTFTEHRADPQDPREHTTYSVAVSWKDGSK
jgi:hypothetical protein